MSQSRERSVTKVVANSHLPSVFWNHSIEGNDIICSLRAATDRVRFVYKGGGRGKNLNPQSQKVWSKKTTPLKLPNLSSPSREKIQGKAFKAFSNSPADHCQSKVIPRSSTKWFLVNLSIINSKTWIKKVGCVPFTLLPVVGRESWKAVYGKKKKC